jgi:hypothetical protein
MDERDLNEFNRVMMTIMTEKAEAELAAARASQKRSEYEAEAGRLVLDATRRVIALGRR